jgi:hypothetical protein
MGVDCHLFPSLFAWVDGLAGLPVVPAASTFSHPDEEAEHPKDQSDYEQQPKNVQAARQQPAPTKKQEQQNQDDYRNHSPITSFSSTGT